MMCVLWCTALLRYYIVIAVIFRYCTVSTHDVGNCNIGKCVVKSMQMSEKCQGIA